MYANLRIGADPEVFLKNKEHGHFIPAIGLIGGTKDAPLPIFDQQGFALQEDNVMVEFNIPPAQTAADFAASIGRVLEEIKVRIPKELEITIVPSAHFQEEHLDHPQAQRFGCDPDYNAWTIMVNDAPDARTNMRTSGGHIHFGYDEAAMRNQVPLIRAADLFLGVPSIILDTDKDRRKMYGKAGAFRPKNYGVEYRTLSNFWCQSKELSEWAFNNAVAAVEFAKSGRTLSEEEGQIIQSCINDSNLGIAKDLCKEFGVAV